GGDQDITQALAGGCFHQPSRVWEYRVRPGPYPRHSTWWGKRRRACRASRQLPRHPPWAAGPGQTPRTPGNAPRSKPPGATPATGPARLDKRGGSGQNSVFRAVSTVSATPSEPSRTLEYSGAVLLCVLCMLNHVVLTGGRIVVSLT